MSTIPPSVPQRVNPYVGLRPFSTDEAPLFFGRRDETAAIIDRLRRTRLLPVVGRRGSGTSSLIRAGVIPALRHGVAIAGRDQWLTAVCHPGEAPLRNLARALLTMGDGAPTAQAVHELEDGLRRGGFPTLRTHLAERLAHRGEAVSLSANLLLVVDEFEELFPQRHSPRTLGDSSDIDLTVQQRLAAQRAARDADAAQFVSLLRAAAAAPELPVYVIVALDSEAIGECHQFDGLADAVNRHAYLVPTLTLAQLTEVIEAPALPFGARVAPAVTERLLRAEDAQRAHVNGDLLPLLQHVLHRMGERWMAAAPRPAEIDVADVDAIGGLGQALSLDAERVVARHDREIVARVFKRLTHIDARGTRVPRVARRSELRAVISQASGAHARLDALLADLTRDGVSLLRIFDDSTPDDPQIVLSSDCLIRHWLALRTWIDEEQALGEWYYALADRASRYARGADVELLTRPAWQMAMQRLGGAVTDGWVTNRYDDAAAPLRLVQSFVHDSRAARLRRNATRAGLLALAIATLVFIRLRVSAADEVVRKQQLDGVLTASLQRFAASDPTYGQSLAGFLGVELSEDSLRASVHRLEERPAALLEIPRVSASAIVDSTQVAVGFLSGDAAVVSVTTPQQIVGVLPRAAKSAAVEWMQMLRNNTLLVVDSAGMLESYQLDQPARPIARSPQQPLRARVVRLARSADSSAVAMQLADGRLVLWRDDMPAQLQTLVDSSFVSAVAFSPRDPQALAFAAGADRSSTTTTITVVSGWRGDARFTTLGRALPAVQHIALAADGRVVALAGDDLLELRNGEAPRTRRDLHGTVLTALNDSAETVAMGTRDGSVELLRGAQGSTPQRLTMHADFVSALDGGGDGFLLSASADHELQFVSIADPAEQYQLVGHRGVVRHGHTSVGYGLLASLDEDDRLRVWSPAAWRERYLLRARRVRAPSLRIDRFGARVLTTDRDSLVLEEAGRARAVAALPSAETQLLALSPSGTSAVLGNDDGTRWAWRDAGTSLDTLTTLRPAFGARGMSFSADGRLLFAAHGDATVSLLDARTFAERPASAWAPLRVLGAPTLDSAGARVSYADSTGVHVRTVATARLLRSFPQRATAPTVYQTLFPSGKRVLWQDADGRVFVREVATTPDTAPQRAAFTGAPGTTIVSFATRADEYVFAYVSSRGGLFLLEVLPTSLRQIALPMQLESQDAVRHVAFDSTGLRIVATTAFGRVHLWELWWDASAETMRARAVLQREHTPRLRRSAPVQLAASVFSRDGTRLHSFLYVPGDLSRRRSWELDANLVRAHADQWKTRCVDFRALFADASREFERDTRSCVFNPAALRRATPSAR